MTFKEFCTYIVKRSMWPSRWDKLTSLAEKALRDMEQESSLKRINTCDWSKEDPELDGPWETECGHYFDFTDPDDSPDSMFQYCPYCGRLIRISQ